MPAGPETSTLSPRVLGRLLQRQAELTALLREATHAAVHEGDEGPEVTDFKEIADDESRQAVRNVALVHAARELEAIEAALARIEAGSHGICVQCGEPISPARLFALPATALCTDCQAQQEGGATARG